MRRGNFLSSYAGIDVLKFALLGLKNAKNAHIPDNTSEIGGANMDTYNNTNTNRKVVLVRGDKSKGYEQAIFILRADGYRKNVDFVQEAERIVNKVAPAGGAKFDYAKAEMMPAAAPMTPPPKKKKTSRFDAMLNLALVITGAAVVIFFVLNFV